MDTLIRGRVWPDGEFCLWRDRADRAFEPYAAAPIDLSKVPNSHSEAGDRINSAVRGLKGITRYGQKMVRNAAYLLQRKHGACRLSFLTCTIPGKPERTCEIAAEWSEITRVFYQGLKRKLVSYGLDPAIAGVTEIQPKRFMRTGGMPLHLHVVFQGAPKDYGWCLSPADLTEMWQRAVCSRVPSAREESFASACNVQMVRDNAAGYLGKYMSKGEESVKAIIDANPDLVEFLPSSWYNLTSEARDLVLRNMVEGESVGLKLERWAQWRDNLDSPFKYIKKRTLFNLDGHPICSFYTGEIQLHWRYALGMPKEPF